MGSIQIIHKKNKQVIKILRYTKLKTATMRAGINQFCHIIETDDPQISLNKLNDSLVSGNYVFKDGQESIELVHC